MNVSFIITVISLLIIIVIFILYLFQARKLIKIYKTIRVFDDSEDPLKAFEGTPYEEIGNQYKNSIKIRVGDLLKSNVPASEFLSDLNVCKIQKLNIRSLDTGAGTLVGLGLLGTFIGLTWGVYGFDSSNTDNIQKSIQTLLSGMGTAFSTSLLGMADRKSVV